jgi:hypothetical protein
MTVPSVQRFPTTISPALPASTSLYAISGSGLYIWAGAALGLLLFLVFRYLDVSLAVALPLSVLIALIGWRFFRLTFSPKQSDVFHPAILVAGYFVMYFAVRAFYLSTFPFLARLGRNPYDDYLPGALWCASAGYVAFSFGVGSKAANRWSWRMPVVTHKLLRTLSVSRFLLLIAIGFGSLVYLFKIGLAVGNYGNLQFQRNPPPGLIVLLANLLDLSWVALWVYMIVPTKNSRRGFAWLLLGMLFCILCVKLAISGGKVALIQPLMEAAIVFHYGKRRFRLWEMLIIGAPTVMLTFGLINFYRFVVVGPHGSPRSISDVFSRVSSAGLALNSQLGTYTKQSALEQMVDRNAGIDALALIMKYTPDPFPYAFGRSWLEIPATFVPRQIWKSKPINIPSAEFEVTYMGVPRNFNGFSSMHFIGDLYRNFSWAGILCGMFFLGAWLRFFYLFCSPSRHNPTGIFLYAALFPEIVHSLEADVGYAFINVSRALVLAIGVAIFLGARFRRFPGVRIARQRLIVSDRRNGLVNSPA